MMSPTWYDLLDVDPGASTDEIRAAWKAAVAELDPTDRRFRTLSEAAAVLLDEERRAAYDAELAEREAELADEAETAGTEGAGTAEAEAEADDDTGKSATVTLTKTEEGAVAETGDASKPARTRWSALPVVPLWLLGAVAVLALAAVAATIVVMLHGSGSSEGPVITASNKNSTTSTFEGNYGAPITHDHVTLIEEHAADALTAAKAAVVPILSYDYRHLAQDQQRAHAYMTKAYQKDKYDPLFAQIKSNAPAVKAIVKTNPPVDAGVVRVSGDRVQVLLFVDRPTTNAKTSKPIPYQNYVTLTMVDQGGRWLVDDMETQQSASGGK